MKYWYIFLLALAPVAEMRGSLPMALKVYKAPWLPSVLLSVAGAFLGGVLILYCLEGVEKIINRTPLRSLKEKLFSWTRKKYAYRYERLKDSLIFVLALIPIPVLGGSYTAGLVAYLFGVEKTRALILILAGLVGQALIITLALQFKLSFFYALS
ncbi:small multi-drug export protein [bacterium]|nr:small multi-drug export protein [bacterium]